DPDIPEPWRSAVVEGANWWSEGFDAAGFADAFRAEVRARETDPAEAGVNPVWWVNRNGRGWSMGAALTDPRSGEILKGNVRLGSQRVLQLTQL
ncbi:Matrixin, partial [Pseudomonas sp. BGM005]|nr:Matrixin [Pseudomonas sp. BG5]